MQTLGTIFLGVSKAVQKKFYLSVLRSLKPQYPRVSIPCVGTFALVDVALQAGFKPEEIECSDVSMFSSVLGYVFSGKPLSELSFRVPQEYEEEYAGRKSDGERAAFLLWLMRGLQIRQEVFYENVVFEYLMQDKEEIIADLEKKIAERAKRYAGIQYKMRDLREVVSAPAPGTVFLVHAPAYSKGYAKQFKFEEVFEWAFDAPEFDFAKEFPKQYEASRNKAEEMWIWSSYDHTNGVPKSDVFFCEEVGKAKYEYFCVTRPQDLDKHPLKNGVAYRRHKPVKAMQIPIVPKSYSITKDTKITCLNISGEEALYYRDLWAHKMGTTKAERYYLMCLDGMAFGVTGVMLGKVHRLAEEDVLEVFGFDQPIDAHPMAHKLFMMLLVSMEFKRILDNSSKVNRIHELKGFKTACITKYRKLKSSTGLLKLTRREKLPSGMYKLMYHTPFYKRSFQETLTEWLAHEKEWERPDARELDEGGEEA